MPDRTPNSKDRPDETCAVSLGSLQEFRCAGLPLHSKIVKERERVKVPKAAVEKDRDTQSE